MSNNESNRPFADQVLEYAGVQVGDIWSDDRTQTDLKVLYIRNTDDPYPVLTTDASHQNAFVNEQYITEMCTLVERGGQVVEEESNIVEINVHEGYLGILLHREGDACMIQWYSYDDDFYDVEDYYCVYNP